MAPLEMVLLTPFLVLMGALMICFGDAALWKIRAQTAVQYAGTQTESFRAVDHAGFPPNPRPANWPTRGNLFGAGGADVSSVQDLFWDQVGPEDYAALQGNSGNGTPTYLNDPYAGNQFTVNRKLIAEDGVHAGAVSISEKFPMLTRLLPDNGTYRIDLRSEFLAGDWYFQNLGLGSNGDRRADDLYNIDPNKLPAVIGLWNDFIASYRQLSQVPLAIDYLDNDQEWLVYNPGSTPPNFYPSRPGGCELDLLTYSTSNQFQAHLRQILQVPLRMASTWMSMYQSELNRRRDPTYVPRGPLSDTQLQQRIDTLRSYISQLRAAGFQ